MSINMSRWVSKEEGEKKDKRSRVKQGRGRGNEESRNGRIESRSFYYIIDPLAIHELAACWLETDIVG